jgi:hypothetical protein
MIVDPTVHHEKAHLSHLRCGELKKKLEAWVTLLRFIAKKQ